MFTYIALFSGLIALILSPANAHERDRYTYGKKAWRVSMQVILEVGPQERLWAAEALWRTPESGMLVLSNSNDGPDRTNWLNHIENPWYGYNGSEIFWQTFDLRTENSNGQWWAQLSTVLMVAQPPPNLFPKLNSPERRQVALSQSGSYAEHVFLREMIREEVEPVSRTWFNNVTAVIHEYAGEGMPEPVVTFHSDGSRTVSEDKSKRSQFPFHFNTTYRSRFEGESMANLVVYWRVEELPEGQQWRHEPVLAEKPAFKPLSVWDINARVLYLVESDGQTVSAIRFPQSDEGEGQLEVLWRVNLRRSLKMPPYRVSRAGITHLSLSGNTLHWSFSNSQFGILDKNTGEAEFHGQD